MNSPNVPPHRCCSIDPPSPFLPTLARWILREYISTQEFLVNMLILLPNRRSCRGLREAFLAESKGVPLLLPKIQPIGDMDVDVFLNYPHVKDSIPEPVSMVRREMFLTRLIRQFSAQYSTPQATELARHLANFIDNALREGVSFDRLSDLVPADLSLHWQQTLEFLTLVTHHWPSILAAEGGIDTVDHRNRVLAVVGTVWKKIPPCFPVIAAGSTGSQPATATLLATIAQLPTGRVILPGLDTTSSEREWEMVSETHPQYAMKRLLETLECKRSDVVILTSEHPIPFSQERTLCLQTILQPPDSTADWSQRQLPLRNGLKNIQLVTADTQLDEARMIGIALRETLKTPGKSAALVTADRTLAKMVIAQMQRYGITIDDSAGYRLMDTPPGCLLRLAAQMVVSKAAPSPLLALLRHPLAALGMEPQECRRLSRMLEKKLLRGIRRASGLEALLLVPDITDEVKIMLQTLSQAMSNFSSYFKQRQVPFKLMLETHVAFTQWLATTSDESGKKRLWSTEAGNQIAEFLSELIANAELMENIDPVSYPHLLEVMLSGETYRPHHSQHPRLHILGSIEARLLSFDRVILGGLNEGSWPSQPPPDPWMSRPMRTTFGLPMQERQIGQSAHDIYLLCSAPEVILTRANKIEGAPTVPSRWLVRMETLVKGLDPECYQTLRRDTWYEAGKNILDAPMPMPAHPRPEPCPPLSARPRQLRATAIDTWLRDPYMIYAQYILHLRKLDPLDKEPGIADFGNLVHKAFEFFIHKYPKTLPPNAYDMLLECGRNAFAEMLDRPAVACLWWPRFERMAGWIIQKEHDRRGAIAAILSELKGTWELQVDGKPFTLTTRIDRLEINKDGSIAIIDYKTGTLPTNAEIDGGIANQLLLEGLIALYGQLTPSITSTPTLAALEYWKLSGQAEDCEIKNIQLKKMEDTKTRLENLIRAFDSASTPYTAQNNPAQLPRFNDYAALTRRQEWGSGLMKKSVYVFNLSVQTIHSLIKFKRAIQEIANIAGQNSVQYTIIDKTYVIEVKPVTLRRIFSLDFTGKHGALNHDPRHDRRKPQRNTRHFAGIERFKVRGNMVLIVVAKQIKILVCVFKKLQRFIVHAGHKKYIMRTAISKNAGISTWHINIPFKTHYTVNFLEKPLMSYWKAWGL